MEKNHENILHQTKEVLKRWSEYRTGIFQKDPKDPLITYEAANPEPLLDEIRAAIKQLNSGKTPGLDNVPAELLKLSAVKFGKVASGRLNGKYRNL